MKVGQQIQVRMDQLGVSVAELAKRVGVSGQAVRHWIGGRSFPGKRHAPALERALSFTLDYTEGRARQTGSQTTASMMERQDIELMLMISRLSPAMRVALRRLVEASLSTGSGTTGFTEVVKAEPIEDFVERRSERSSATRGKARPGR